MWRKFLIVCLFAAVPWSWAVAADSSAPPGDTRRLALVIGNQDYPHDPLAAATNDARAMDERLRALGFAVTRLENAGRPQMQAAIAEFGLRLAAGGVGLFYFAGHGLHVAGRTLLLPVDTDSRHPARLLTEGIDLDTVLAPMSRPRPGQLNLLILDACLTDPFPSSQSGHPAPPEQTLIAYATAPGTAAAEGTRHGLFTAAVLNALSTPTPGQSIETLFAEAQSAVRAATERRQVPWWQSSLPDGTGFPETGPATALASVEAGPPATPQRGVLPKDSAEQYELVFWESIKDSTHIGDYEAYLQAYPKGRFAALARSRIERLRAAAPKVETPPAPATKPPTKLPPTPAAKPAPAPAPAPASAPASVPIPPAPAVPQPARKPAPDTTAVSEIRDCPSCPALITLPRGNFTMGSNSDDPSEKPAHPVSLAQPFAVGKYEVTAEQWNACANADACPRIPALANAPANTPARDISWDDAQQYVKWLSKTTGKAYRLPTEAEWEFAARGGTSTRYWWGEQMRPGSANCKGCGEQKQADGPASVGSFPANPYGLHDMNGSVWEWVEDCWHNTYQKAPADGSAWTEPNCRVRVIRGGSWRDGASYMLSTTRFKYDASVRHSQNGFRVARELK